MSRRSAADLAVVKAIVPTRRPEPPADMSPAEAREWNKIVSSMPADWFTTEMFPLLISLCRIICTLDEVTKEVKKTSPAAKEFAQLGKTQLMYIDAITKLSTKLRLTPQSRYTENSAKRATKEAVANRSKKPWGEDAA
jgi:hypothetical protein